MTIHREPAHNTILPSFPIRYVRYVGKVRGEVCLNADTQGVLGNTRTLQNLTDKPRDNARTERKSHQTYFFIILLI